MKFTGCSSVTSGMSYSAQPFSIRVHGQGFSQAICASTAGSTASPHMCRPQPSAWSL